MARGGKKAGVEQRKKEKLAAKRAEAKVRARDLKSVASDKHSGLSCADFLCAN